MGDCNVLDKSTNGGWIYEHERSCDVKEGGKAMEPSKRWIALLLISIITSHVVAAEEGLIAYWNFDLMEEGETVFFTTLEDYEEGRVPPGWAGFNRPAVISGEKAFSGERSVKLDTLSASTTTGLRSPKVQIEEGFCYVASAQYLTESGTSTLYFEFWDDSDNRIKFVTVSCPVGQGWHEASLSYMAPIGAKYASILLYRKGSDTGVSYFDDLKIARPPVALDVSGNGRHGYLYNNTYQVEGRLGNALKFDGVADYVEIPYDPGLSSPDAISVEAWIYPMPPH